MPMKYLKVFYDWPEVTKYLKPAQKGELIDALVRYARGETDVESSLKGAALMMFPGFKRQIDQDAEQYAEQTERNRENGKKGGRPKKETQENPENPVGFSETQVVFEETEKSQDKEQRQRTKTKNKDEDLNTGYEKKGLINQDNNGMFTCTDALSVREKEFMESCTSSSVEYARNQLALPNDNWLYSERALHATAQHVVDAIVRDAMWGRNPAETDGLYDTILGVLEDRQLRPLAIYMMATRSAMRTNFYQRLAGVIR